jgi:hypothetical protein
MIGFLPVELHRPSSDVAWFSLTNGLAQILTGGVFVVVAARVRIAAALAVSAVVMTVGGWILAMSTGMVVALCAVAIVALANNPFNIAFMTLRQTAVPNAVQGRVSATLTSLAAVAFLLGSQAASWVADLRNPRLGLLGAGAVLTIGTLVGLAGFRQISRPAADIPTVS